MICFAKFCFSREKFAPTISIKFIFNLRIYFRFWIKPFHIIIFLMTYKVYSMIYTTKTTRAIKNTYYEYILTCWISYSYNLNHIHSFVNESLLIFIFKTRVSVLSVIIFKRIWQYSKIFRVSFHTHTKC